MEELNEQSNLNISLPNLTIGDSELIQNNSLPPDCINLVTESDHELIQVIKAKRRDKSVSSSEDISRGPNVSKKMFIKSKKPCPKKSSE